MNLAAFDASLDAPHPPDALTPPLRALWYDARGDWARAHKLVQEDEGGAGAWVHAYLHRKEGDLDNAAYWYRRAGKPPAKGPLDEEHRAIVAALLEEEG